MTTARAFPAANWTGWVAEDSGAAGRRLDGSGLGLYTAMRAMTEQAGSLSLDRSPAGGLRVRLQLPGALAMPGTPDGQERQAC